ncbi:MAG: stage II sporulation protein M [Dethiobacteria bacterium]
MSELWTHLWTGFCLFAPLALNNLGVMLLLWLVSAIWLYYALRTGIPEKRVYRWALFCYLFFFFKEFIRVTRSVADFSCCFSLPYWDVLFTLVLPHGAIEYLAFALGAAYALAWLSRSLSSRRRASPGARAVFIPATLIILAAVIESAVTPYLFEIYMMQK